MGVTATVSLIPGQKGGFNGILGNTFGFATACHSKSHICSLQYSYIIIFQSTIAFAGTTSTDKSYVPDSNTLQDLEQQLKLNFKKINRRYTSYVHNIRTSLKKEGVTASELCAHLMTMSEFSGESEEQKAALSAEREELKKTTTIDEVFILLSEKHASFLNYDIFQSIQEDYGIKESTNYPEHLEKYIKMHKIKEFADINPLLETFTDASKKMVLKVNIESTRSLAKVVDLQMALANVLGVRKSKLKLFNVKEGCVLVTMLIPAQLADLIFTSDKKFTTKEVKELQALSITWLECNGCMFNFTEDINDDSSNSSTSGKTYAPRIKLHRLQKLVQPALSMHTVFVVSLRVSTFLGQLQFSKLKD